MHERTEEKRQAHNELQKQAKAERRWKSFKLYDIHTGKPVPEGAPPSKRHLAFEDYVRRHINCTRTDRTTYVEADTGAPAPSITKASHKRGQHTTRFNWLLSQKRAEFSKYLEEGRDLPPVPSYKSTKHRNAPVVDKQQADLHPAHSTFFQPIAEASSASGAHHSPVMTSRQAAIKIIGTGKPLPLLGDLTAADLLLHLSSLDPATPSTSPDKISSAASSVSARILPPANQPSPTPLDKPFGSNPAGVFDPSAHSNLSEASDAVTRPRLDPVISAAQSACEQDQSRKRRRDFHSFFQPEKNDRAGHASRKAKTMPADGSAEHPLPETDTLDSTSAESFTLSPPAKTPSF